MSAGGERLRIALAGGGTGGHLVPALNLLAWGVAQERIASLLWFVTGRAVEERVIGDLGARFGLPATLVDQSLEGRRAAPGRLQQLVGLPGAVARARRELARFRPHVVLGTGGFGSTPAVLAARSARLPVVLLEVNAVRGSAVRWLGPIADRVCHSLAGSLPQGGESTRHRHTGPPEPAEFAHPPQPPSMDGSGAPRRLLVLGGSQGAGALNRFVAASARALVEAGVEVVHQVGPNRLDEGAGAELAGYRAHEYLDDVPAQLLRATLVLCRGGASTLVEVAAARCPAVVVPYPHHADRHQWRNAAELGAGARIVDEARLAREPDAVRGELLALLGAGGDRERDRMGAALAGAIRPGGSAAIFDLLEALSASR